jgi:hypothetical protein
MSQGGIMSFLSLNKTLTNQGGEIRQLRLPRMNPFPKLDGRIVQRSNTVVQGATSRPVACGALIIDGGSEHWPEMTTDVIDAAANYAVENVKREPRRPSGWSRIGFGHLVGRMLDSHRAARL